MSYRLVDSLQVPEQRTRKVRNQGTTKKNSRVGHCTLTAESANVKIQNVFHGEITLHVAQPVNTEELQYSIET
jgi:hypothetical protein